MKLSMAEMAAMIANPRKALDEKLKPFVPAILDDLFALIEREAGATTGERVGVFTTRAADGTRIATVHRLTAMGDPGDVVGSVNVNAVMGKLDLYALIMGNEDNG